MTENNYYRVYVDSIHSLAASLMIKCGHTAAMMNEEIGPSPHYDEFDPSTWKYYLNVCGEYFPTDERMIVTSLDDMTEIEFSKENLKKHQATATGYEFGTKYYYELVDRFPQHEFLIRGILYPADMDTAITARDGTILAYPPGLIESTEYSLHERLQAWIYNFLDRWDAFWFNTTDNLYKASLWAVFFSMLPSIISNLRLQACKTKEAHSYHVRQYLSSHSRLDRWVPYMTREQQMFFYRNIAYIEHNNGMSNIFSWLIENLFTRRGLPIADFTFAHNLQEMMGSLQPVAFFNKNPINTLGNIDGINEYSLPMILDLEQKIEPPNEQYREEDEPAIVAKIVRSLANAAPTKVLESSAMDYTDSEKYRLSEIMMEHWIWFAAKDLYRSFVRFTIPSSGIELSMSAKDAVVMYAYTVLTNWGLEPRTLGGHRVNRVQRLPPDPTFASPRQAATTKRVSDEWIQEVMDTMPEPSIYVSVKSFRDYCIKLFRAANLQYKMSCIREIREERAQTHLAYSRLWETNFVYLGDEPNQSFRDWFVARNIAVRDITKDDWIELEGTIVAQVFGEDLADTVALKDVQRAMIATITNLASYSIHISADINLGPVIQYGCPDIRYTYQGAWLTNRLHLRDNPVDITDMKVWLKTHMKWNTFNTMQFQYLGIKQWDRLVYCLPKIPGRGILWKTLARYRYMAKAHPRLVPDSLITTKEGRFDQLDQETLSDIPDAWDYASAV